MFAWLNRIVPIGWNVGKEDPVALIDSEPEPDVSILRGEILDYSKENPTAGNVALVIEVADSSLRHDRTIKKRIMRDRAFPSIGSSTSTTAAFEVFEDLTGPCDVPDYRKTKILNENETLTFVLDGQEVGRIAIGELLPR